MFRNWDDVVDCGRGSTAIVARATISSHDEIFDGHPLRGINVHVILATLQPEATLDNGLCLCDYSLRQFVVLQWPITPNMSCVIVSAICPS